MTPCCTGCRVGAKLGGGLVVLTWPVIRVRSGPACGLLAVAVVLALAATAAPQHITATRGVLLCWPAPPLRCQWWVAELGKAVETLVKLHP